MDFFIHINKLIITLGNNSQDITKNKEMFSDDEVEDEFVEEEVKVEQKREAPKQASPVSEKVFEPEPEEAEIEEDVPDDVEIIDDEHLEEELEEEENDEEEISDVDDTELLTRLEAKYGRLPEPERTQKHSKHDCMRVTACSCNITVGFIILLTN